MDPNISSPKKKKSGSKLKKTKKTKKTKNPSSPRSEAGPKPETKIETTNNQPIKIETTNNQPIKIETSNTIEMKNTSISPEKLKEIESKREHQKKQGKIEHKKGVNYKLVCPLCEKPNSLTVHFCTGCSFPLTEWDQQQQPDNIFLELINGKDIGANVLLRNNQILVFDDKFGVSDGHLDIIPVREIQDITSLTKEDIPLLKLLYNAGLNELKKKNLPNFGDARDISQYVTAGFNYPVSILHLHLHMVVPPFKHKKVFQYPRWHSFKKVLNDLELYGTVNTYDKFPNEEEGATEYDRSIKAHDDLTNPPSQSPESLEEQYNIWQQSMGEDCLLYWIEIFPNNNQIQFNYDTDEFILSYPDPEDPDSVYFIDPGSLSLPWVTPVNEFLLTEGHSVTFPQILDKIVSTIKVKQKKPSTKSRKSDTSIITDFEDFILTRNWALDTPNHWHTKDVLREIKSAQSFFGANVVTTYGTGHVSVKIEISDVMTSKISDALEIDSQSPAFVHLDFSQGWSLSEKERIPYPKITVSQHPNQGKSQQTASNFGVKYHLTAIVMRYVEDSWKWSTVENNLNLGNFTEEKGHNQDFKKWQSERQQQVTKVKPSQEPVVVLPKIKSTPPVVDSGLLETIMELGFKKEATVQVLSEVGKNYEKAVDRLLAMGPEAQSELPKKANSDSIPVHLINQVTAMGFSKNDARSALKQASNDIDMAISILIEGCLVKEEKPGIDDDFYAQELEREKQSLRSSGKDSTHAIDAPSFISKNKTNFFLGLMSYVRSRLSNYCRYCMICHVQHSCRSEKPVVCCNPLCIFRYSELLPQEKKNKISEVDRITICPFTNCFGNNRNNDVNQAILSAMSNNIDMDEGNNQEALLEMHAHRYLPNHQIVDFIENGVKRNNVKLAKIENVLKPELVAKFERKWGELKGLRGEQLAKPQIAYHGTAESNVNSILERGLLVPGKGEGTDVAHTTDNGWWGGGIYLSPDASLSIGYCRGGKQLLICSVLMGKPYTVNQRMDGQWLMDGHDSHIACNGTEWVIFDPSQVLPCYLISFGQ